MRRIKAFFTLIISFFSFYLNPGNRRNSFYAWCVKHLPIRENLILYESHSGIGMICNPYALFLTAQTLPELKTHTHIWVLKDKSEIPLLKSEHPNTTLKFVIKDTLPYLRALATAKILIQNSSFGNGCFSKRDKQIYLNTWHGTALKTLGFDMPGGAYTARNQALNMLASDYILSPNEFMSGVFRHSFRLQGLYEGKLIEEGYPRNDLIRSSNRDTVIQKLISRGVSIEKDKKLILFAPTWRGTSVRDITNTADDYPAFYESLTKKIDQTKYQLLIKPHHLAFKNVTKEQAKKYNYIPPSVDTNELLSIVDILVSDFSSIYFDYLLTDRPVLFYIPDKNEYEAERGTYEKLQKMPGPVTDSIDELALWLKNPEKAALPHRETYQNTKNWALKWDDGHSAQRVCDILFLKKEAPYRVKNDFQTGKTKLLLNAGEVRPGRLPEPLVSLLNSDLSAYDVTVMATVKEKHKSAADEIAQSGARVLITYTARAATNIDRVRTLLSEKLRTTGRLYPAKMFQAECRHRLGGTHFDLIADTTGGDRYTQLMLLNSPDAKRYVFPHKNPAHTVSVKGFEPLMAYSDLDALSTLRAAIAPVWYNTWSVKGDELVISLDSAVPVRAALLSPTSSHPNAVTAEIPFQAKGKALSLPLSPILAVQKSAPGRYALLLETDSGIKELRLRGAYEIPVWQRYLNGLEMPENPRKKLYFMLDEIGRAGVWARTPVIGRGDSFSLVNKATLTKYHVKRDTVELRAKIAFLPDVRFDDGASLYLRNRETDKDIEIFPESLKRRDVGRGCTLTARFSKARIREKLVPISWHVMIKGTVQGKPVFIRATDLSFGLYKSMTRFFRRDERIDDTYMFMPQHNQYAVYLCCRPVRTIDTAAARRNEGLAHLFYRFYFLGLRKKPIILFEKNSQTAQDNGFALFEYYRNVKKADNVYYVMDENSPQAYKLKPYWDHVLPLGSYMYYVYILSCVLLVGSDGHRHVYELHQSFGLTINKLARKKIFFLQHGVIAYKRLTNLFAWESRYFDYFTSSTTLEKKIIHDQLHYPNNRIPLLGLCRWDKLRGARAEGAEKTILLFPTWRSWLEGKPDEFFLSSEYFERITHLMENASLRALLAENGITMTVFLHPKMESFTANLVSGDSCIRIASGASADLSSLVKESDMVITDYSSIAWDFAYQRKPVLLYQFDRARYLRETGAYIDISEPMLGPVVMEEDEVISAIARYAGRGFAIEDVYRKKIEELFDFPDEVCRGTDEFIQKTALPAKIVKLPQNYPRILAGEVNRRWRRLCAVNREQEKRVGSAGMYFIARVAVRMYDLLRRSAFGGEQNEELQD